jgi:hypothetical protein
MTLLKAKCSSPPVTLSKGNNATCKSAIPQPIRNREHRKTGNIGRSENNIAPEKARIQANTKLFFSSYFWTIIPEGIDIKAYAIKKENGSNPVIVPFKEKLSLTFGLIEPRMLVRKEMAKKIRKMRITR